MTSWIPKGTIGTKINFHFKPFSPRINELIIYNGYIKNYDLWQANSRVKKLRLYVDQLPMAILELDDVTNMQSFSIDAVQSQDSLKDLIVTLEIIEIYNGTKYDDVAISEVNFDGLDVHCFAAGTKITMNGVEKKNIELIVKGDLIKTYNPSKGKYKIAKVKNLIVSRHNEISTLWFGENSLELTSDHPVWTNNQYWASLNPEKSNEAYQNNNPVRKLNEGDSLYLVDQNKLVELNRIEVSSKPVLTYTLELESQNNFIANGILVKTEVVTEL